MDFLRVGARVASRYRIESLLGAGGMGQVYRAVDEQLGRRVALKIVPAELTSNAERLRRFMNEARAASTLNHPSIVTVHEVGSGPLDDSAETVHFIVTELIEGITLREHLAVRAGGLPANLQLVAQIADGLAKAHDSGVIHRDLKPENVMISGDGFAKIVDFGLAKLLGHDPALGTGTTAPGTLLGTVGYMAPEQVRGAAVDHRADIFSLGAVLFEVATGRRAFHGPTAVETLHDILYAEPAVDDLPPALERIVRKCLAKEPDHRYTRARDLAEDLRHAARSLPARPHRPRARVWRWLAAGTIALVVVVTGALALRTRNDPPMPAPHTAIDSLAVLPFENRSGDPALEYLSDGLTESVINALGRAAGVRVISRSSVFRYKGAERDPAQIARDLDVETLILGHVQRRGDRYAVSVELVSAHDAAHLWGEQYDVPAADLADVQDDIARRVSDRLAWRLGVRPASEAPVGARDAEVYRLYLRGRYHWNRRAPTELRTSIDFYDDAIALQPDFALAHAARAEAYAMLVNTNAFPAREALPEIARSATRALELDPSLADAHLALAFLHHSAYRWQEAEQEVRRALELSPGSASAHQWLAIMAVEQGRFDESFRLIDRALELDPFALPLNSAAVVVRYLAGRYDDAVEQARRTTALDPTFSSVHRFLSRAYVEQGRYAEALQEAQEYARLAPSPVAMADLAIVYARSGDRRRAEEIAGRLAALARTEYVSAVDQAALATALGRDDEAYAWLERAFAARADALTVLGVDPRFARLRGQARFRSYLRRMRLDS